MGDCPLGTRARATCKHQRCKSCCAKYNDGVACSAHSKGDARKSRESRKRKEREVSSEPEEESSDNNNGEQSEMEEASDDE